MTELKWTRKTTAKVAAELRRTGIRVSPNTVARLLKTLDYRLRSNEKKIARCSPAARDDQFRKIAALRKTFEADGLPIISIDTKKKGPLQLNLWVPWRPVGCKTPGNQYLTLLKALSCFGTSLDFHGPELA